MVAAATNNLCEAANAAVQGHASQEKLISSAKQVAASTAQLLVACKVKADQDSEAMKRLQVRNLLTHCLLCCAASHRHTEGFSSPVVNNKNTLTKAVRGRKTLFGSRSWVIDHQCWELKVAGT